MFESGLEFVRADFHMHTIKDKEFKFEGNPNDFSKEYVKTLKEAGINLAVITNHNKFDLAEFKSIRKNARKEDIFVLPGVELTVKEGANGIHTLIVFNPEEWIVDGYDHIQTFLTQAFVTISNPENKNAKSVLDLKSTLEALDAYGRDYFVIFAHVDQGSGLFHECDGGLLESFAGLATFKKRVLALQKSRTRDNIGKFEKCFGYVPALVEGSDPKTLNQIGKDPTKTFLKIGEYSFEAVKFALQDHKERVFSEIPAVKHGYIESISFEGGKFDGQKVSFSNALNTLIGIRGSGKSSILESIRYIFDQEPKSDEQYKKSLIKNIFESGGKATIILVDKHGKKYVISRILGEKTTVIDEQGTDLNISPVSLIDGFQYFGQKDLSSSADQENQLLDQLVSNKIKIDNSSITKFVDELSTAVEQLLDVSKVPEQINEATASRDELKHKMDIFREKGVADKLKKQTGYTKDSSKLKTLKDDISSALDQIRHSYESHSSHSDALDGYTSEYNSEKIEQAKEVLLRYEKKLAEVEGVLNQLTAEISCLDDIITSLSDEITGLSDEFASIKREIKDDTLDVDSYVTMTADLEKLGVRLGDLEKKRTSRVSIEQAFQKAARQRNDALKNIYDAYKKEADQINESQDELKIEINFKADKAGFKDDMKKAFRGTSISETKCVRLCEEFSDYVGIIEDWIINNGKKIQTIITSTEYGKLETRLQERFKELLAYQVQDSVEIFYHGKSLQQHSIGQRASALILFILMQNKNDIILIDQPEDDLDNKVIYDEVIKAIANSKPEIQFIFATHNANIPVLGDAERVITVDYQDVKIEVHQGNIDLSDTHQQIVDIMEGGKEAFEKRQLVYTSWK